MTQSWSTIRAKLVPDEDAEAILAAWRELLETTPAGWEVAQPSYHVERDEWTLYAFDPSERLVVGKRSRE